MDGLLLVRKPSDCTSHDVVLRVRKILSISRVGHFGTLDPQATGLMLIAVGKTTRLFPFLSKADKVYTGVIRLGFSTDTYDKEGARTSDEVSTFPAEDVINDELKALEGEILQTPPPYSAKKYKGKPLYSLARKNISVTLDPVPIFLYYFRLVEYTPPLIHFEVKCSSGTYIRSLAHDLGQSLECGAHLAELTRTSIGSYRLKDGFSIEEIEQFIKNGRITDILLPMESLLPEFPKILLNPSGVVLARNGNSVYSAHVSRIETSGMSKNELRSVETFRLFSEEGQLIAFAKQIPEKNCFHPHLVIETGSNNPTGHKHDD
ncbi:tRNA pseudouridine(55) synthase TruB [Acidobacteriota bacterium]